MKLKDIKVGEDYAVGSEQFSQCRTALEVGVHGQVSTQGGWRRVRSAKPNYVKVGHDTFKAARSFLRPWAEQVVINEAARVERAASTAVRARVRRLRDAAPDLLKALKDVLETSSDGDIRPETLDARKRAVAVVARVEDAS